MIDKTLYQKLEETEESYKGLQNKLADPAIFSDQTEYQKITKKLKKLEKTVDKFNAFKKLYKYFYIITLFITIIWNIQWRGFNWWRI